MYHHMETVELYADEYDPVQLAFQAMVDEGLDEEDPEAIEHAADILQAEPEAGHYGFWSKGHERQFQAHGSLSLEEKRQHIQALKSKSSCRQCGQVGHWANDPICPKGSREGKGKGSSASTTSTASTAGNSSHKSKGSEPKQRTVYFAINEYNEKPTADLCGYMVTVIVAEDEKTADEILDSMIAQAQVQQAHRDQAQRVPAMLPAGQDLRARMVYILDK